MRIKCSHDLYGGDVIANKWYQVTDTDDGLYYFIDETGFEINAYVEGKCAYLDEYPGAFWTVVYD